MTDIIPDLIRDYDYLALFVMMWIESYVPIFPTDVIMPLAGMMSEMGNLSITGVILAGVSGSFLGSLGWYWLARLLGYERFKHLMTRYGWFTTVTAHEVDKMQAWFLRFGSSIVLFGRFVPGIRLLVSIPAGLTGMSFPRFVALTLAGTTLSFGLLTGAGWLLRDQYTEVEHYIGPFTTALVATTLLVWMVRMIRGFRHRRDQ